MEALGDPDAWSGTFSFSTELELEIAAKVRGIVCLNLNPRDKAVVLCVD